MRISGMVASIRSGVSGEPYDPQEERKEHAIQVQRLDGTISVG